MQERCKAFKGLWVHVKDYLCSWDKTILICTEIQALNQALVIQRLILSLHRSVEVAKSREDLEMELLHSLHDAGLTVHLYAKQWPKAGSALKWSNQSLGLNLTEQ